jgi:excisionase family DNA binding protein
MAATKALCASSSGSPIVRSPLLDIPGVADWLGTSPRHVRRLVSERRIPYVKVGHFVRFDEEEVAGWIDEKRVGPLDAATGC